MITLKNILISRVEPTSLLIRWEFKNTQEDLNNYVLDLYRAEGPSSDISDYTLVQSDLPVTDYSYSDTHIEGRPNHNTTWYYKVLVKNTLTLETSAQPTTYAHMLDEVPNFRWSKIYNHKKLVLERKSGQSLLLLKKRNWGQVKTESDFDPILMVRKGLPNNNEYIDNYYYNPIRFLALLNSTPKAKEIAWWGEVSQLGSLLYTLNNPPLEPGDVVIDPIKDYRFKVGRVRTIELMGYPFEQQAQLELIAADDEMYKYDITGY